MGVWFLGVWSLRHRGPRGPRGTRGVGPTVGPALRPASPRDRAPPLLRHALSHPRRAPVKTCDVWQRARVARTHGEHQRVAWQLVAHRVARHQRVAWQLRVARHAEMQEGVRVSGVRRDGREPLDDRRQMGQG